MTNPNAKLNQSDEGKPTESVQQDAPVNRPKLDFWGWWRRDGNGYDPDFSDIPWFDKRKFLAEKAFDIGVAQSTNYVADQTVYPQKIAFANGRIVSIAWENGAPFLNVELQEQITVTVAKSVGQEETKK